MMRIEHGRRRGPHDPRFRIRRPAARAAPAEHPAALEAWEDEGGALQPQTVVRRPREALIR
jgi:hypothetical protein